MYLSHFVGSDTKEVMLIHISDHDNTHELAYEVNRKSLDKKIKLELSYKDKISEMIEI